MDKKTFVVVGVGVLLGLGVGYFTWGVQGLSRGGFMMGERAQRLQNIDQHFIAQMIPHHEGAIAMAKIALTRSKRPEVLSLAQGVIDAQELEIKHMQEWYETWFGAVPPLGHRGMHMVGMEGNADILGAVGEGEFDREFLEQMIVHHEMAVMMAQMLENGTERDEMRVLADGIITSQTQEIEMMRSWLEAWY